MLSLHTDSDFRVILNLKLAKRASKFYLLHLFFSRLIHWTKIDGLIQEEHAIGDKLSISWKRKEKYKRESACCRRRVEEAWEKRNKHERQKADKGQFCPNYQSYQLYLCLRLRPRLRLGLKGVRHKTKDSMNQVLSGGDGDDTQVILGLQPAKLLMFISFVFSSFVSLEDNQNTQRGENREDLKRTNGPGETSFQVLGYTRETVGFSHRRNSWKQNKFEKQRPTKGTFAPTITPVSFAFALTFASGSVAAFIAN